MSQKRRPSTDGSGPAAKQQKTSRIPTLQNRPVTITVEAATAAAYKGCSTLVYMAHQAAAAALNLPEPLKHDFAGRADQVVVAYNVPGFGAPRVVLVGLGAAEAVQAATFRAATAAAVKELKGRRIARAAFAFPEAEYAAVLGSVACLVASTVVTVDYAFDAHLTDAGRRFHLDAVALLTATAAADVDEHVALATSTCAVRDLMNTRGDVATPQFMQEEAEQLCRQYPSAMELRVVDFEEIEAKEMNLIRAVGKGAVQKPRIVFLHYKGNPAASKSLALVGKGICFDSGGLNLKPTGSIEQMHMDKGGACAVFGAMHAVAARGLKANVVGVLVLAENAISAEACKPHEILKSYKGLTVQNMNTDFEGRLVLADAMTYCQKEYDVDELFTVATLTGSIIMALGCYAAGMFTTSDATAAALTHASKPGDERVWRMPMFPEYAGRLKGTMADLHSGTKDKAGFCCTSAAFLHHFVESGVAHTHLDIAGVAGDLMDGADDRPWMGRGGTGWGPNILYHYIRDNRCA